MKCVLQIIYIISYLACENSLGTNIQKWEKSFPLVNNSSNGVEDKVRQFLIQLLCETLKGHHIFLFYDELIEDHFRIMDYVLQHAGEKTSVYTATLQNFCFSCYGNYFFRQGIIINIFIFHNDIECFLNSLNDNVPSWGPSYVIAVSINPNLDLHNIVTNPSFQRSSRFFLAELSENNFGSPTIETFKVLPHFNNETLEPSHKVSLGIWKSVRQFEEIFEKRYHDFRGALISLGSWCDDFPYLYDLHLSNSENCIGSNLDALTIIGEKLNFIYDTQYEPSDKLWGSFEDGNWTGMLADIKYRGKDLIINSFPIGEDKNADFDFANPYRVEGYGFMAMLPAPLPKWKGPLLPFSRTVWISTILSGGTAVVFMIVLVKMSPREEIRKEASYIILSVFGSFFRQSWNLLTLRTSYLKLWITVWLLTTLIITTAYTSNLISFLTVQLYPHRIETIEDIVSAKPRVLMSNYGSFVPDALKTSKHKILAAIGRKLDLINLTGDAYGPAMDVVTTRSHILIESTAYIINLRKRFNLTSETYVLKDEVYTGHLAYFFPKNSPLQKPIGDILTRLIETGIAGKLFWDHMNPALRSTNQNSADSSLSLKLSQLMGCFFLVLLGYAAATVTLFIELLLNRSLRRRRSKLRIMRSSFGRRHSYPVTDQKSSILYHNEADNGLNT